jgi:hypothetical protein
MADPELSTGKSPNNTSNDISSVSGGKKPEPSKSMQVFSKIESGDINIGGYSGNTNSTEYRNGVIAYKNAVHTLLDKMSTSNDPNQQSIAADLKSTFSSALSSKPVSDIYDAEWHDLTKKLQSRIGLSDNGNSVVFLSSGDQSSLVPDGSVGLRTIRAIILALNEQPSLSGSDFSKKVNGKFMQSDGALVASDLEQDRLKYEDSIAKATAAQAAQKAKEEQARIEAEKNKQGVEANTNQANNSNAAVSPDVGASGAQNASVDSGNQVRKSQGISGTKLGGGFAAALSKNTWSAPLKAIDPSSGSKWYSMTKPQNITPRSEWWNSAKTAITDVKAGSSTGGFFSKIPVIGKLSWLSNISKASGFLACIGGGIEGFKTYEDYKSRGDSRALGAGAGAAIGTTVGGIGGIYAAAATGAAIGTLIPVPILGTAVGAIAGLAVGFICAEVGKNIGREVGAAIAGTPEGFWGGVRNFFLG